MTSEPEHDNELNEFLLERAGPLPDAVLRAVDAAVRTTPQLRAVPAELPTQRRRFDLRPLLAAAAVVVLAVGLSASGYLPGLRDLFGPGASGGSPSPPPTAAATQGPSATPPAAATPSGLWTIVDVDGSPMTLSISNSASAWSASWVDLRATMCAGGISLAQGAATWDGSRFVVADGLVGCEGSVGDQPWTMTLVHDASSDTLTAFDIDTADGPIDMVWHRGPAVPDAFDGTWIATDIDGSALTMTFTVTDQLGRAVQYHDEHGLFCTVEPGYTAAGQGTIGSVSGDGRFLAVTLAGGCDDGSSPREVDVKFEFAWASGTLIGPLAPLEVGGTRGADTIDWARP